MAFDSVYTYLPDRIKLLVGDVYIEGWEKISIEHNYTKTRQIAGIRGKNTKVYNRNSSAKITVTLSQSSDTNYLFDFILKAEEEKMGNILFKVSINDLSGGSKFSSEEAYLEGFPKRIEYSGELGTREWVIFCDTSTMDIKGNKDTGGTALDKITDFVSDLDIF